MRNEFGWLIDSISTNLKYAKITNSPEKNFFLTYSWKFGFGVESLLNLTVIASTKTFHRLPFQAVALPPISDWRKNIGSYPYPSHPEKLRSFRRMDLVKTAM